MSHHNLLQEIERVVANLRSPVLLSVKDCLTAADLLEKLAHMVREANWRGVES